MAWIYINAPNKEEIVVNDRLGNNTKGKYGDYYSKANRVTLLGVDGFLRFKKDQRGIEIELPNLFPDYYQHAYVFKLEILQGSVFETLTTQIP